MNKEYEKVKKFHETFDHPVAETPKKLTQERVKIRYEWMLEEVIEFLESEDMNEQVDAMADLIYFALGTLVEIGIPPQKLFDIVHEANMSKLFPDGKPHFREGDGKTIKPKNWEDPRKKIEDYIKSVKEGGV